VRPGRFRVRRYILGFLLVTIASYLIWDQVESRRLGREIAAIAARGEPVYVGDGDPQPRTQEQREASSLYRQAALFAMDPAADDNHRASRLDLDRPGGAEISLEEAMDFYRPDAAPLQLLDRATPLDFVGFREEDRGESVYELPLITLGNQAFLRADLMAVRGEGDAAARALVPAVRLHRTLQVTSYRSQHAARVLGSLRILFRHAQPSEPSLATLQRAFDAWPDEDGALRSVLLQRARFIDEFAGSGGHSYVPAPIRILLHPFVSRSVRLGIASFEPAIAMARLDWPARWEKVSETRRDLWRPAPRGGMPSVFRVLLNPFPMGFAGFGLQEASQELSSRRVAVTVLAVERFRRAYAGTPPASLDVLVPAFIAAVPQDPFSAKPLMYRKEADGYVVYSVDSNRRDDRGALYGHGSAITKFPGPQSSRDIGIRVPLKPVGTTGPGTKGPRD
jgi:hypothetical protein